MKKDQHFILHKPYGYLSQFINNKKRKKKLLSALYDFPEGTMAIGRLDVPSEGLLFLTTNGKTSQEVRSSKVEKEYYVQVDGIITKDAITKLQQGVIITHNKKPYLTKKCNAFMIDTPNFADRSQKIRDARHGPTSWVSITLTEGKFRQVRKMTAAVGFPTLRLVRIRIGKQTLDQLSVGEVKQVDSFDL